MAAREALSSITADMRLQKQADSIPLYLEKYGHHIDIINLHAEENNPLSLSLPGQLNLSSLLLANINLLSAQGLYPPSIGGTALKQLQLFKCSMLDEAVGIALLEAVSQLTKLESLSMSEVDFGNAPHIKDSLLVLPMGLLERFKHLTALRLNDMWIGTPEAATPVLQPLQALTASLVDLELQHLKHEGALRLTASMLAGAVRLTNLTLVGADHDQDDGGDDNDDDPDCAHVCVEADILARRTVLQRLHLGFCRIVGGAAGVAQLLSHVKPLNQLTYLSFRGSLPEFHMDISPSAYSSITACSKLKILDLSVNTMPKGVWQHMLPAGRLVSNLVSLIIFNVYEPSGDYLPPPEGSRLVSCCPSLQELSVSGLYNVGLYNPEVLAALPKLTGLTRLSVEIEDDATTFEFVEAVCQFTRLRELDVFLPAGELPTALMHLTTLEALTSLSLDRNADTTISPVVTFTCEVRRRKHTDSAGCCGRVRVQLPWPDAIGGTWKCLTSVTSSMPVA